VLYYFGLTGKLNNEKDIFKMMWQFAVTLRSNVSFRSNSPKHQLK
jgi:hypothetical protein